MVDKEEAVWKTYPGIDFLQANQYGEVRTLDHYTTCKNGRKYFVKGHVLKQCFNKRTGYMQVDLHMNSKHIRSNVHRIVATCFLPNPDNLPEVNHKDNDRVNNNVSNLEWCTRQYNNIYKENFGTSAKEAAKARRKPLYAVELKTLKVSYFESQNEVTRQLGLNQGNINNVLRGYQKQTGGYWFCYADEDAIEKVRAKFSNEVADEVEKLINEKLR